MMESAEAAPEPDSIYPAGLHRLRPGCSSNIVVGTMEHSSGGQLRFPRRSPSGSIRYSSGSFDSNNNYKTERSSFALSVIANIKNKQGKPTHFFLCACARHALKKEKISDMQTLRGMHVSALLLQCQGEGKSRKIFFL